MIDESMVRMFGLTQSQVDAIVRTERTELERRKEKYDSGSFLA